MKRNTLLRQAEGAAPKSYVRLEPAANKVVCIHCYRILGRSATEATRAKLQSEHVCAEALLAKVPSAPPPYN